MSLTRIWAEIDLNALHHNIEEVRRFIGRSRLLVAVKADAYGHGLREVARELAGKVDAFGVASVEEGISLRKAGLNNPIIVLSPATYGEIPDLFEFWLTPSVTEPEFARRLSAEAQRRHTSLGIHIEVDTGMGRTGVSISEALDFVPRVASLPGLRLEGVFTHFPAADTDIVFTEKQLADYRNLLSALRGRGVENIAAHAANSAGLMNIRNSHLDMVRPGLIVYGILPESYREGQRQSRLQLKPVMNLRSRIVNLREFEAGVSISYERNFFTRRRSRIAVITAGYGDGYPYALRNRGQALVSGRRAPVVGNVCMDLTMLDVTDIPEASIGDEVTLLGSAGKETITASELANWADTIPYEILCRVSPRVPRIYIKDGHVIQTRTLLDYHANR